MFVLSSFLSKCFVRRAQILSWVLLVILIVLSLLIVRVLYRLRRSFGHERTITIMITIKSTRLESKGLRQRTSLQFGCSQRAAL